MATLEELLQAETGDAGGEYVAAAKYATDSNYNDEQIVDIVDRHIGEIKDQTSTSGEERSQCFTIRIERYIDGIDLVPKTIKVHYYANAEITGDNAPINVRYNDQYILLTWVIPPAATQLAGDLQFMLYAVGESYLYKTLPATYTVNNTLQVGGGIVIDNDWYADFVRQMDAKIAAAAVSTTAAQEAQTAAETAQAGAETALASTEGVLPELETKRVAALTNIETSRTGALADVETARAGAQEILTQQAESTVKIDDVRRIAPVGTAAGAFVSVDDAADWRLAGLELMGKSEQAQLAGKNLICGRDYTGYGITVAKQADGSVKITGTASTTVNVPITATADLQAGTYYSNVEIWDSVNTKLADADTSFVLTETKTVKCVKLITKDTVYNAAIYPQLEAGAEATDYEPYCGAKPAPNPDYPQEIKSVVSPAVTAYGRNLCPVNCITTRDSNSGAITIRNRRQHGTYILSCDVTKYSDDRATDTRVTMIVYYTDGTRSVAVTDRGPDTDNTARDGVARHHMAKITPPIEKEIDYILLWTLDYSSLTAAQRNAKAENIQLELSDTATAYEPYTGNTATLTDITLRSLPGDIADKLCKRDGVWGVERAVGVISGADLNGGKESYYYILEKSDLSVFVKPSAVPLCDKLKGASPAAIQDNTIYTRISGMGFVIRHDGADYATFKDTLTIQYHLATPTWEPLPDTIQTQLNSLQSHAGQTNIFTDSSLQPELAVEYVQDINKLLAGLQAQINSLQQA